MSDPKAVIKKFSLRERRLSLRKFREQADLSLDELAQLAGLSKSMLSKFELGQRDLSPDAYGRLERAVVKALAHQEVMARRKRQSEMREAAKTEKLAISLSSLVRPTLESYQEGCKRMEQMYGSHWREVFKELFSLGEENDDLKSRLKELRDLLALETDAAVTRSQANEKREAVLAKNNLSVAGMQKENIEEDGD